MNILGENLLNSMEILAQNFIQQNKSTQMIECTVVKRANEEDIESNEYRVKYLDNIITVFSNNRDIKYQQGDKVYVLVPDGDFDKEKIIISSSTPSTISYDKTETDTFLPVSENLFNKIERIRMFTFFNYIEGCPKYMEYEDETNKEGKIVSQSSIKELNVFEQENEHNFNNVFQNYLQNYNTFRFSVKIKTEITPSQRVKGNYGLILTLPIKYKTGNDTYTETEKKYVLDINSISGNPYKLSEWTIQNLFVSFTEGEIYDDTRKPTLTAFIKDFDQDDVTYTADPVTGVTNVENPIYDIFMEDFVFEVYATLPETGREGYVLHLQASDGNFFFGKKGTKDEKDEMPTKTLTPALKYNGKPVTLSKKKKEQYECYWFVEDASIKADSELYSSFGGIGWRCLNKHTAESFKSNGTEVFSYVTNDYQYIIQRTDVLSSIRYKCAIAIIQEIENVKQYVATAESIITIGELVDPFEVKLQTTQKDNSTSYPENGGQVILICSIDEKYEKKGQISFAWSRYDNFGRYIDNNFYEDIEMTNSQMKISFISKKIIGGINTISCTVYDNYKDKNNIEINQILGTATIAISTTNTPANITLQNSTVMYKYDGDGDSPISPKFDGQLGSRMIIKPVQLSIYHQNTGEELTEEEYKNCTVIWKAPGMLRSMIQPLMGEDDETLKNKVDTDIQPVNEDDEETKITIKENSFTVNAVRDYHTFTLTGVKKEEYYFYYTIDDVYDYEKSDNTITAEVIYNDNPIPLSTDFVFTKEGDNGTNNSTYTAVITHNGNAYGEVINQGDNRIEQKLQLVYIQGEYEQVQELDKNGNLVDKKTYVYKYKLDKKGNPIYKKGKPVYEKDKDGNPIIYGEAVPVKKVKPFENKAHWCYHNLETNKISLMAWMEKEYPEDEAYSIIKLAEDLPVLDIRIYNKGQEVSNNEDLNIEVEWSVFDPLSTDSTILLKSLTERTPEEEEKEDPFAAWKSEKVKGTRCQVAPLNLKKIIPSWGDEILNPDKPEEQKRVNHVNIIQAKITIRDESKAITEQRKNNDSTLLNNFTEIYAYYPIDIAMTDTIDIIAKKNKVENGAEPASEIAEKSAAELMLDKKYLNDKEYNIPNVKGGFSFVTYNSDGKSPGYNSMNDFYCTDICTGEEMGYNNYHWLSSENIYLSGVEIIEATEDGEGEELVISEHHSRIKGTPFDTYNSSVVKNFVRAEIDNLTSLQDNLDEKIQAKAKIDNDINFINEFEASLVSKSAAGKYVGLFIDFLNQKKLPIKNSKSFLNYRNDLCKSIKTLKTKYKKIEKYIKEPFIKLTDKDFEDLFVSFIDGIYYEYDKDGNIIKEIEVFYSIKDEFHIIKDYRIDTNIFNKFLIADDFIIPEQGSTKKNDQAKDAIDRYKKLLNTAIIEKKVVNGFNNKAMFDEKNDEYTLKESYAAFCELSDQFKTLINSFEIFIKELVQKYYNVDVLDFKVDVFGGEPEEIRPTKEEELSKFKNKLFTTLKKIFTTKIENIKESDIIILKGRDITEIQEIYNEHPKAFKKIKIANIEAFTEKYLKFQTNYINTYTIEGIIKIYYNDLWKPLNELNNNFIREKTDTKEKPYNYYQKTINTAYATVEKFYNISSKKLTSKLSKPCKNAKDILKVKSNTMSAEIQQTQLLISAFAKEDNSVALVYIRPIIMMYNRYELTAISGWDGSRLYVDEANDAYLYAPQVGAGRKNGDGTFTGMVMGRKNTRLNKEEAVGLFGYSGGRQSMFLDADTGAAYFGLNKEIQLIPGGTSTIAGWDIDNGKFEFVSDMGTVGLYTLNKTTPTYPSNGTERIAFQAGDIEKGSGSVITYDGHFYTTHGVINGGVITDKTTLGENVTIKKVKNGTVENSIIDGTILNNVKKDIKHSEIKNTLVTGDIRTTNNVDSTGVALIPSKGLLHYEVLESKSTDNEVVFSDGQTSGRVDWCLGIDGLATFNNIHCTSLFSFGNVSPKVEDRLNVWQRYINPDKKDEILEEFYINKVTIGEWDVNHGIVSKTYTFSTKEEDKDLIEKIVKLNSNDTETFYLKGDGELYCQNIKAGNGVTDSFMIGNKTVTITNGIITKIE